MIIIKLKSSLSAPFVALNLLMGIAHVIAANSISSRCTSLTPPEIAGLEIVSIEGKHVENHKLTLEPGCLQDMMADKTLPGFDFCNVTIYLSHPG